MEAVAAHFGAPGTINQADARHQTIDRSEGMFAAQMEYVKQQIEWDRRLPLADRSHLAEPCNLCSQRSCMFALYVAERSSQVRVAALHCSVAERLHVASVCGLQCRPFPK